ncbi:MAG: hypothetical protein K6E33_06795 [Lachnospiraceae bacterium]|nr:hypothetical protein [Lachnospiraceae bacterium]
MDDQEKHREDNPNSETVISPGKKQLLIQSATAIAVVILLSALAARLFGGGETLSEHAEKMRESSVEAEGIEPPDP